MQALRFTSEQIVWQEVPNETSLAYFFSGCPLRCKGCHSADLWKATLGTEMTPDYLRKRLKQYRGLITCVLFMGGEWHPKLLGELLGIVKEAELHACLYTGLEKDALPQDLLPYLTYLKTGRWMPALGGLDSPNTNQRFIDLRDGTILNDLFLNRELKYDSITA